MIEIIDHLCVGTETDSRTPGIFDAVINCTKKIPFYTSGDQVSIRVGIDDGGFEEDNQVLFNEMPVLVLEMNRLLNEKQNVLVHCRMGQQRSCTVIAAFLIWKYKWGVEETMDFMKTKHKEAFMCGANFDEFLGVWHDHVIESALIYKNKME